MNLSALYQLLGAAILKGDPRSSGYKVNIYADPWPKQWKGERLADKRSLVDQHSAQGRDVRQRQLGTRQHTGFRVLFFGSQLPAPTQPYRASRRAKEARQSRQRQEFGDLHQRQIREWAGRHQSHESRAEFAARQQQELAELRNRHRSENVPVQPQFPRERSHSLSPHRLEPAENGAIISHQSVLDQPRVSPPLPAFFTQGIEDTNIDDEDIINMEGTLGPGRRDGAPIAWVLTDVTDDNPPPAQKYTGSRLKGSENRRQQ